MPARHFLILMLLAPCWAAAQSFVATPAPVLEQELAPEQANEGYIFFDKLSPDTLRLRWKLVEASYPPEWTIDLCDFGTCYVGIPASGLMNPAAGFIQPYLKLIVQPGATPGDGWLWFRVYEDGQPANFADVYFSLFTPGITPVQTPANVDVRIYPNPVSDLFYLENNSEKEIYARLIHISGVEQWAGFLPSRENLVFHTSAWPAGIYFLQTSANQQVVLHLN